MVLFWLSQTTTVSYEGQYAPTEKKHCLGQRSLSRTGVPLRMLDASQTRHGELGDNLALTPPIPT